MNLFDPDNKWHWIAMLALLMLLVFVMALIVWPTI